MDPLIIRRIGTKVGKVEEVDVGEGGSCVGKFARVRVTRPINEPLVRCIPLKQEGSEVDALVLLQYEKLSNFCYLCGCVGHISRDCQAEDSRNKNPSFGSWLRAGRSFVGKRDAKGESRSGEHTSLSGNFGDRWVALRREGEVEGKRIGEEQEATGGSRLELGEDIPKAGEVESDKHVPDDRHDAVMHDNIDMILSDKVVFPEVKDGDEGGVGDSLVLGRVGEVVSSVGSKKKGMGKSPTKVHTRLSKPGGRSWKKLARVRQEGSSEVGRSEGVVVRKGGTLKRKGGLLRDEDGEDEDGEDEDGHAPKHARVTESFLGAIPTAVAAEQPCRLS